jgi:hypothetical protein
MPLYEFIDTETGEKWEDVMSYDSYKTYLAENPTINPVYSISIIGNSGDRIKTDSGFNDVLGRIAQANPHSPLAQTHGDKSIKAVKTREVVKKHKSKG